MTRHRSHHKSSLPQAPRGENVLGIVNMSAKNYAAAMAGDPMVARAVERLATREKKWRRDRLDRPSDWTASTAQSRRRERRRLQREGQREEQTSPTTD